MNQLILLLLLFFSLYQCQNLISFDIEPRIFDIEETYSYGNVYLTFDSSGLCDTSVVDCWKYLSYHVFISQSFSYYEQTFSSYQLVNVSGSVLSYKVGIYPSFIHGISYASIEIYLHGVYLNSITNTTIIEKGFDPRIQVISPSSTIQLVNLTFPDYFDLSNPEDPLVFTLTVESALPISQGFLYLTDPNGDQITVNIDYSSITYHKGETTILQFSPAAQLGQVGEFTILQITLSTVINLYSMDAGFTTWYTVDLIANSLPTSFTNKPLSQIDTSLPDISQIGYFLSDTSIPLSWGRKEIDILVTIDPTYQGYLKSIFVFFETEDHLLNQISLYSLEFPLTNNGILLNMSVNTELVVSYQCTIVILGVANNSLLVPCGTFDIYSPYPNDTTAPTVLSTNVIGSNEYLITLHIQDDSGISKVSIVSPYNFDFYNNQRVNGTDQDCFYELFLDVGFTVSSQIDILVYDFNHQMTKLNLTLGSDPIVPVTYPSPMIAFNTPTSIVLNSPTTFPLFFDFKAGSCEVVNGISIQAEGLIGNVFTDLTNYQNIINGTTCDNVMGQVFVFPQTRMSQEAHFSFIILAGTTSYNNYSNYPVIINPNTTFQSYQPIVLEGFQINKNNVSSGDQISFSLDLNSNLVIFNVNLTLSHLNQKLSFSLVNTYGTYYVGTWSNTFTIPTYANNGTWTISIDYATDQNDFTFTHADILSKGFEGFLSIHSIIDNVLPTITSVDTSLFSTNSIISVSTQDSVTGLKLISMILTPNNLTRIYDPSKYLYYSQSFTPPGTTTLTKIQCKFTIPDYFYPGAYYMFIKITDFADNSLEISPDILLQQNILPTYVNVTGAKGFDNSVPSIQSVTLSTNSITTLPSSVTIQVGAIDSGSGIKSFNLILNGTNGNYLIYPMSSGDIISGDGMNTAAVYKKTIQISSGVSNQLFQVSIGDLTDNAGNTVTYSYYYIQNIITSNTTLQVNTNSVPDVTLPTLQSLTVSTNSIDLSNSPPKYVTVNVTISDTLPLLFSPIVTIQHSTQNRVPIINCQITGQSGGYTYYYKCNTQNFPTGYYYIHINSFADQNGNYNSCYMCNSILIIDSTKPKFGEYTSVPTVGGRAYFSVENFVNDSSTMITFNGNECPNLQFESYDIVSCYVGNGTGVINVQGISSGHFTNILKYEYEAPSIESTTSVLFTGGNIVIQGKNFGNSTDPGKISILIGTVMCIPISVNDTLIFCKLLPYTSSAVIVKNVYITVNTIDSFDGTGKFQYGVPSNTPCSPSSSCSGNGQCISGICLCSNQWSGAACNEQSIIVNTNTSSSSPTIIINPDDNQSVSTVMTISVVGFNELNIRGQVVKYTPFTQWTYIQSSDSQSQNYYYTSTLGGNSTVSVLLQIFKIPSTIKFAGSNDTIPENGMKYSINITNYGWQSQTNVGQLILQSQIVTEAQDETFCSSFNSSSNGGGLSSDDLRWVKVSQGGYSVFGKFSDRAVIDGRATIISNVVTGGDLQLGDQAISTNYIGINIPHFYIKAEIDPSYSVLLNPDSNSQESDNYCSKSTKNKWLIPVIATICSVVGVALIIGGVILFKRMRLDRQLFKSLSRSSS